MNRRLQEQRFGVARCTLFIGLLLVATAGRASELLTDVPLPAGAVLEVVGIDVVHNGQRVSMATFDAPQSIETTVAFYQNVWQNPADAAVPGVLVSETPEWLLLSRFVDGYNTVVQLRSSQANRSSGFVSIMPLNNTQASSVVTPDKEMVLLSDTESNDEYSSSRLTVHSSALSVGAVTDRLIRDRENDRWSLTSRQAHGLSHIVLMSAKARQLELIVSPLDSGETLVVSNEVVFND